MLTPLYDELLVEAVGQEVSLSVVKQKRRLTVVAMRTPAGGLHKPSLPGVLLAVFVGLLWAVVGAAVVAGLAFIAVAVLTEVTTAVVVAVAIGAVLLLGAARTLLSRLQARAALG